MVRRDAGADAGRRGRRPLQGCAEREKAKRKGASRGGLPACDTPNMRAGRWYAPAPPIVTQILTKVNKNKEDFENVDGSDARGSGCALSRKGMEGAGCTDAGGANSCHLQPSGARWEQQKGGDVK